MSFRNVSKALIAIVFALGLTLVNLNADYNKTAADENQYNNQLLKLKLSKSSDDTVNVKLYTSKPYPTELSPVKRTGNNYIIYLPETYHSITSKPSTSSCSNLVSDVDVKLIPYMGSNSNNGYTKITIKTNGDDLKFNVTDEVMSQNSDLQNDLSKILGSRNRNIAKSSGNPTKVRTQKPVSIVLKKTSTAKQPTKKEPSSETKALKSAVGQEIKPKKVVKVSSTTKPEALSRTLVSKSEETEIAEATKPTKPAAPSALPVEKKTDTTAAASNANSTSQTDKTLNSSIPENQPINENSVQEERTIIIDTNNATVSDTTKYRNSHKKTPSGNPLKVIFPIILLLPVLVIILKVMKKLRNNNSNQSDIPLGIREIQENWSQDDAYREEYQDGYEEYDEDYQKEETPEKLAPPIKEPLTAQRDVNTPPEHRDVISQLLENPLKTGKNNILKPKEKFEKEEFYAKKSVKSAAIHPGIQSLEDLHFLAGAEVDDNRGFYLVEVEKEKALIGVTNSEVFVLNKFNYLKNAKFIVRKTTEKADNKDLYYVQIGTWGALISSDDSAMNVENIF